MTFKCEKCGMLRGIDLATEKPDIETSRYEEINGKFVRFSEIEMICPVCNEKMVALIEERD